MSLWRAGPTPPLVSCSPVPGFPTVLCSIVHYLWGAPGKKSSCEHRMWETIRGCTGHPQHLFSSSVAHYLGNCSFPGHFKPRGGKSVSLLLALGSFSMHCHFPLPLPVFAISPLHETLLSYTSLGCFLLGLCQSTREENFEKPVNNGTWVTSSPAPGSNVCMLPCSLN